MPEIKLLPSDLPFEYHVSNIVNQFLCHFDTKDRDEARESFLQAIKDERSLLNFLDPVSSLHATAEKILKEKGLL